MRRTRCGLEQYRFSICLRVYSFPNRSGPISLEGGDTVGDLSIVVLDRSESEGGLSIGIKLCSLRVSSLLPGLSSRLDWLSGSFGSDSDDCSSTVRQSSSNLDLVSVR